MLDQLKTLFKDGLQYTHTAGVLQQISNLVNIVNTQYTKDGDAKNAAIDIVCQILQSHKDVIPVVPAAAPEAVSNATN
jgi:hypothetical protein